MSDEDKIVKKLEEQINDLVLRSHSSRDREMSGLVRDFQKDLEMIRMEMKSGFESMRQAISTVEDRFDERVNSAKQDVAKLASLMEEEVRPNAKKGKEASDNQKWINRLVIGALVLAALTVIGINS